MVSLASSLSHPHLAAALQALQSVCTDMGSLAQLPLPEHFMRRFFLASLCVDMHHNAEALQHLQVGAPGSGAGS